MERLAQLKIQFNTAISQKALKEAKDIIDDFKPQNSIESRVKSHYEGCYLAAAGMPREAIEQLQLTRHRFGDNLNILKDLITLYKTTGQEQQWIETTSLLTDSFNSTAKMLSVETKQEVLYKLFVERLDQGYVDIAFKISQRALKQNMDSEMSHTILKTTSRASLLLNIDKAAVIENDLSIETLSSISKDSSTNSLLKLKSTLQSSSLTKHEKSVLFFDCVDSYLFRGVMPDTIYKKIPKYLIPAPVDYFTSSVESFMRSMMNEKTVYWFKLSTDPKLLRVFDEMRLLTLQMRWGTDRVKQYSEFQFQKRMQIMDIESQILWSKRLQSQ